MVNHESLDQAMMSTRSTVNSLCKYFILKLHIVGIIVFSFIIVLFCNIFDFRLFGINQKIRFTACEDFVKIVRLGFNVSSFLKN